MPDQDDGARLVQEVMADNPVEEKGVRDEWKKQVGWHRKESIHRTRGHQQRTAIRGTGSHNQPEQYKKEYRGHKQRRAHHHRGTRSSPAPDGREVEKQEPLSEHVRNPTSVSRKHHKAHAINEEIRNDLLLAMVALLLFAGGAMALLKRMRTSATKEHRSR